MDTMNLSLPPAFQADRRAILGAGLALVLVHPAHGQIQGMGMAPGKQMAEAIAEFAKGQRVQTGRVKLEIAELVDNGNVVPVSVSVDSPMSAADHVLQIALFNDRNPQRDVAVFTLGPRAGRAQVATRMRLSTSQQVSAVARMNDGSLWIATVDVIVALAACIEVES
jgi:sulfur-oxidizing protein SoxY